MQDGGLMAALWLDFVQVGANARETLPENVTVNAKYAMARKLNTSMSGNATIICQPSIGWAMVSFTIRDGLCPRRWWV